MVRYALQQGGVDTALTQAWCDADAPPLASRLWDTSGDLDRLERLLRSQSADTASARGPLVVGVRGRSGSGRRYLVERACARIGIGCIALDARKLRNTEILRHTLTAAFRDSVLLAAAVLVHHADVWLDDAQQAADVRAHLQALVRELGWIVVLASDLDINLPAWFPAARAVDWFSRRSIRRARESAWRTVRRRRPMCRKRCTPTWPTRSARSFV